ncbi:MAG: MFS transporter [Caulobacterales bacterium]|nr:MFS transporter [Caulobacterales bacterium]
MSAEERPSRSIDIAAIIDARPIGALQARVVVLCALIAIVDGFDTQAIAFVGPLVAAEFAIATPEMGRIFAAALIGLMAGAFSFSPIADRIGRKPVIIASCAIMGVSSLLTATASSGAELLIYRFATGLGLGGAMPSINTLTSEFAPARRRAVLMTVMFAGFPLGAALGGLLSAELIAVFGWRSVFILGGAAPLALILVLIPALPESIRHRAQRDARDPHIGRVISRLDPSFRPTGDEVYRTGDAPAAAGSMLGLFQGGRGARTALLWIVFFANLLMMYTLISWLPSVMRGAGLPLDRAIITTVVFNLGGVAGGLAIAWIIDRSGPFRILAAAYATAAVSVTAIGAFIGSLPVLFTAVLVAGFTIVGTQFGLNALAVSLYPTTLRSTGLGWALAIGRIGAILGPIIVGAALARGLATAHIFLAAAAPALACIAAVILLARLSHPSARGDANNAAARP